ncbi:MAG: CBS domain-containing protein [Candidatus Nomurabacteria bacterium]|jgi:CBS domain containing-hemolysin-like protein|nr:CBS domain-containing protein [Candidatus Nomurabacteria bacterium]
MDIFRVVLAGLILVVLLAFRFKTDESRFEINRLAEHGAKYKTLARFLDIYPGLLVLMRVLALIDAILLVIFAAFSWGLFAGGAIAFATILLAWLFARILHSVTQTLIGKHLKFFNKYFAWASVLGRIIGVGDESQIGSEHELMHLVEQGDFLDDQTKILLKNALAFRDQTVSKIMTPRDRIAFVHARDALTPKLLDELFTSGHKVFPVAQGSLDRTVGLLYLDDVLPVGQEEKILTKTMRKCPPPIDQEAPLESVLNQMCEYHSTLLMVSKNDKIVGLVTLKDVIHTLSSAVI